MSGTLNKDPTCRNGALARRRRHRADEPDAAFGDGTAPRNRSAPGIGRKRRDILLQFLFESVVLTCSGGLAGLVLGIGSAILVGRMTTNATALSWEPLVLAVALSLLVGLVFGLVPARRASKMPPVDALR